MARPTTDCTTPTTVDLSTLWCAVSQLYLHRQSSTVSRGQLQRKHDTRAESRARYDLPNQGSADEALTISPLFKGDTALEHYEAGLPNAYCAPWRHAGVSVVQL